MKILGPLLRPDGAVGIVVEVDAGAEVVQVGPGVSSYVAPGVTKRRPSGGLGFDSEIQPDTRAPALLIFSNTKLGGQLSLPVGGKSFEDVVDLRFKLQV